MCLEAGFTGLQEPYLLNFHLHLYSQLYMKMMKIDMDGASTIPSSSGKLPWSRIRSVNFFRKRPKVNIIDSTGPRVSVITTQLFYCSIKTVNRQYRNKWVWLGSSETLFTKDLSHESNLPPPDLEKHFWALLFCSTVNHGSMSLTFSQNSVCFKERMVTRRHTFIHLYNTFSVLNDKFRNS